MILDYSLCEHTKLSSPTDNIYIWNKINLLFNSWTFEYYFALDYCNISWNDFYFNLIPYWCMLSTMIYYTFCSGYGVLFSVYYNDTRFSGDD